MGLHVLLHVGLLGKGSATHDALEGLLTCVTEGEGTRSQLEERGGNPQERPVGVGCQKTVLGTQSGRAHLEPPDQGFET